MTTIPNLEELQARLAASRQVTAAVIEALSPADPPNVLATVRAYVDQLMERYGSDLSDHGLGLYHVACDVSAILDGLMVINAAGELVYADEEPDVPQSILDLGR